MFSEETKIALVDNLGVVAELKIEGANIELMFAVVDVIETKGLAEVTAADLASVEIEYEGKTKALTQVQTSKVFAVVEFHKSVAVTKSAAKRERTTVAERYTTSTTVEERDQLAVDIAEMRINAEGTKPIAWKKIREAFDLKLDEFHKVIRHSSGYRDAVLDRIEMLKGRPEGWSYNGKLSVLTGLDDIEADLE